MKETRQNFTLKAVKTLKNGGLKLDYQLKDIVGEEVYLDDEIKESSKIPHPDLKTLLKSLKPTVSTIMGYAGLLKASEGNKVYEKAQTAYAELMERIEVTGISISGSSENRGFIITSVFTAQSGQRIAINSHRIRFVDVNYGFEAELEGVVTKIEDECYSYLFENKKAQLELFQGDEQ